MSSLLRLCAVTAVLSCAMASMTAAEPRLVVLVRHAEKAAAPADDPPLSADGEARAADLAQALGDLSIDAVITTQFLRTKNTAAPLVRARGLTPVIVGAGGDSATHVAAVAAAVRARAPGETVLVVGHSNTVPAIIGALGGPALANLCDTEYANLFVLVFSSGKSGLLRSHYGKPDPPTAADCHKRLTQGGAGR